MFIMIITLFDI